MDITYILEVNPRFVKGPAYNIKKIYPHTGIFKAVVAYPELKRLSSLIDVDKFFIVNTCGKFWQIKAFWSNIQLLFFLLKNHFDLVHLTWPANIYEMVLYFMRKKMILTVHDPFPHTGLDTWIVRLRRKIAFKLVPLFIILNKAQKEKFLSFYHLSPSQVIGSSLSCYCYLKYVTPNMGSVPQGKYILFVGKISRYKGLDYLLPAMIKIHEKFPDVKLVIAGSGKYYFDISKYKELSYIDIRNRFITDEELVALIKNSLFLVCPYTDATQSGVIMSSFAFNTPVVATRVGGLPEMLSEDKFGVLVREKNVDSLVTGICSLLEDENRINILRKNISESYDNKGALSWYSIAMNIRKVYEQIVKN